MSKVMALSKRNTKLYFASKSNIFFSMLALIILVALHFIVFRSMNADVLLNMGLGIEEKWALWFSDSLMLSSLIPIGAVTISLTTLGQIVVDKEKRIINDFYVTPISKNTLLTSYLVSSLIVCVILLLGFVLFFEIYLIAVYGISFTLGQLLSVLGVMALSILLGNTFVLIVVSFVKREQAMGAIGTILGTMLGFICGAYVPVGTLGDSIAKIFTVLPFLPITALARQAFFMNISDTGLTSEIIGGETAKIYGYDLYMGTEKLSSGFLNIIVVAYVALFALLLIFRFKKMKNSD